MCVFIAFKNLDGLDILKPGPCLQYFIFCLIEIEINDKPHHTSMTVCIHALFTEENRVNIPKHTHLTIMAILVLRVLESN